MRVRRLLVLGAVGCAALLAFACGLEQGGIFDGPDATVPDATPDRITFDVVVPDHYVPPPCDKLDASCLPAFPAGWAPVAISPDGGCPIVGNYSGTTFYSNPTISGCNVCACATNNPTCATDASVRGFGPSSTCASGGSGPVVVSTNSACDPMNLSPGKLSMNYPGAPATTCTPSEAGTGTVDATAFTVCSTSTCEVDYCGLKSAGYQLCIYRDDDGGTVPCPTGYTPVKAGATAAGSCGSCGCNAQPARCVPSLTTFSDNACATATNEVFDGSCATHADFNSAKLTVTLVDGSCTPTTPIPPVADLFGRVNICCAP